MSRPGPTAALGPPRRCYPDPVRIGVTSERRFAASRPVTAVAAMVVALTAPAAHAQSISRGPGSSATGDTTIAGVVTGTRAVWDRTGSSIFTRAVIRDAGGVEHSVWQLGGTVDGIGMVVLDAPAVLVTGDQVSVRARAAATASGAWRLTIAGVSKKSSRASFVRTTTAAGKPLRWAGTCAVVTYDTAGTREIPGDDERAIMDGVLAAWSDGVGGCSSFVVTAGVPRETEVGYDFVNAVKFRDDKWCRPATGDMPEMCFDGNIAGVTTLTYIDDAESDRDGEILDADIELNGVNFALTATGGDDGEPPCESVLANTFTHEVGHLIGLDHTCWSGGPRPKDQNGNDVPSCNDDLPPELTEATMYNFQDCGETKKASPEADDIAGVCAAYPDTVGAGVCRTVSVNLESGCAIAGHTRAPLAAMVIFLSWYAARATARRRRKRSARRPRGPGIENKRWRRTRLRPGRDT